MAITDWEEAAPVASNKTMNNSIDDWVEIPSQVDPRDPQAQGRPSEEKFTTNALGERVPDTMQQVQDFGRGAMKGFADAGESITSLFGNVENPVSKEFLGASQYWADEQIRPSAGSVGEGIADELTGGAVGGPVGKLLGLGRKAYHGAITKNVARDKTRTTKISDANKAFAKENKLPVSKVVARGGSKTATPIPPGFKMLTETIGKLSPTASKIVEKYSSKILAPVSRRAAVNYETSFVNDLVASGVSKERANNILKVMKKAPTENFTKTGTAIGTLLGASKD